MELKIYKKPFDFHLDNNPLPHGTHITVSGNGLRIYFAPSVVEEFKMLSFPPVFALTNENEWALILGQQCPDAFGLHHAKGQYFFQFSDIVHRMLGEYNKSKIYFRLRKTSLPHVFILKEYIPKIKPRRKLNPQRETLASLEKSNSYYDTMMKKLLTLKTVK